jgi:hypothetical protein
MKYRVNFDRYDGGGCTSDSEASKEFPSIEEAREYAQSKCDEIGDGDETDYSRSGKDYRPAGEWYCGRELGSDGHIEAWIEKITP